MFNVREIIKISGIFLKGVIDAGWQYVQIHKRLLLHFIDDVETNFETFFPKDDVSFYQNVFMDAEKVSCQILILR